MSVATQGIPPRRIDDIQFFSWDKLSVRFQFTDADRNPIDLSFSSITAKAISNNHPTIAQPSVATTSKDGYVTVAWTAEQVETLPMYFLLVLGGQRPDLTIDESETWDSIDGVTTWDDYPDLPTWSGNVYIGDEDWEDLPDDAEWGDLSDETFMQYAIWDRSVVVVRFTRNDAGLVNGSLSLSDNPVHIVIDDVA